MIIIHDQKIICTRQLAQITQILAPALKEQAGEKVSKRAGRQTNKQDRYI